MANRTIVLAGAGGGWYIFGGFPLFHERQSACKT